MKGELCNDAQSKKKDISFRSLITFDFQNRYSSENY